MKQRDNQHPEQRHDTIKSHHIEEHRYDPYKARDKLAEPSACPQCGAVFAKGRWLWMEFAAEGAKSHVCPACHRTNDNYPAGELTLSGSFLAAHAPELMGLARNSEEAGKRRVPAATDHGSGANR